MDVFNCTHYLEALQLNKGHEKRLATSSLLPLVMERYASTCVDDDLEQALKLSDIVEYLNNIEAFKTAPLSSIIAQTEAIGDPGLPSHEQQAIMKWLNVAYSHWETQFPIEPPLADEFRKLLPLAAALAISEPNFLIPGAHGFHSFMDASQASLVGWQSDLGRAGQNLEQKLVEAITKARGWLEGYSVDLKTIFKDAENVAAKDRSRAQRMAQRVVETELGRLKVLQAKTQAAQMINGLLINHPTSQALAVFIKGPWYESLQLVWLRFGGDSAEWASASGTTKALLASLAPKGQAATEEPQTDAPRQQFVKETGELQSEVKRWLFSLQHDYDSIDGAIDLIANTHAAVLRRQNLVLKITKPIPTETHFEENLNPSLKTSIEQLEIGQWYLLKANKGRGKGKERSTRLQLVLKIEAEHQLLFTNHAGIKARHESYVDFATGLKAGKYQLLPCEHSFSRSLVHAANHSTPDAVPGAQREPEIKHSTNEELKQPQIEQAKVDVDVEDHEQLHKEYEATIKARRERETSREARRQQRKTGQRKLQQEQDDKFLSGQAETQRLLRMKAEALRTERDKEAAKALRKEEYLERKRERDRTRHALLGTASASPPTEETPNSPLPREIEELHLLTGTWFSFFDSDTPLLAKLAGHDQQRDIYTFVDRYGMKLRESSNRELATLLDEGQVKVIEAQSTFRNEVIHKKNKHKD